MLLLHGVPAGAALWGPLVERLSGQARVVAPDLPGFGGSAVAGSYELPCMLRWLRALRRTYGLGPQTRVVGQDWGGVLGAATALEQGAAGLVLVSTPLDHAWLGSRLGALPGLSVPLYHLFGGRLYLATAVGAPARGALLRACAPTLARPELPRTMRRIASALRLGELRTLRAALRADGLPVRLVWGERDRMFGPRVARRTARALDAPLTLVPKTGQGLPFERPDAVEAALRGL